jgi:hypothetical protein
MINMTNKEALYNFLSTFSGTHFVSPRAVTGELDFHFWGVVVRRSLIDLVGYKPVS